MLFDPVQWVVLLLFSRQEDMEGQKRTREEQGKQTFLGIPKKGSLSQCRTNTTNQGTWHFPCALPGTSDFIPVLAPVSSFISKLVERCSEHLSDEKINV